ncbi:Malonyl CoA-acyl carrier protein transacylase [Enhygromyxa salina]|uniref:Malonyl CoA-acyl carrier protein transacylase n=2 Tax=Enhygromyxa salina TaxID=215803 RepID=A0A0C2CK22_9BACT|nr:Malonyl CoA-acyl carrier protein transacylase [Enhygromyxa salina]
MARVFEPKIAGLQRLVLALEARALTPRWIVLCSSVAAAVPALGVGMSDYAAANTWMDRCAAANDRRHGCRWLSLQWPNWVDVGMGELPREPLARLGIEALRSAEGVALFERALAGELGPVVLPCLSAHELQPAQWLRAEPRAPRANRATREVTPAASTAAVADDGRLAVDLDRAQRWLRGQISAALELPFDQIESDSPFEEFGLDSILMVRLLQGIDSALGMTLDPSLLIEHDSVARLVDHLAAQFPEQLARASGAGSDAGRSDQPAPPPAPAPDRSVGSTARATFATREPPQTRADEPIAIVGMACHFPDAPDLASFWRNLQAGHDAIREVPPGRWSIERFFAPVHEPGKTISRWGGFLDDIERFDPAYFELDEAVAAGLDPLIRQALEVGAETFAHAGYRRAELAGTRTGVYMGARVGDFARRLGGYSKHGIIGVGQNFIAAHLAHFFDLRGPNLVVDSACSSSLVTVHQACQSLRAGEIDLALAGGVDLLLDEQPYLSLSESRALSPEGRCYTFDRRANGFVPGEGCGMVLLARLSDALANGDQILAVIEGSAVNNDGRTMGVTTPNPEAQVEVVHEALRRAGVEASSVSLIEAHGTATLIGDPIELKALTRVFRASTDERGFCGIGSVKTNIGHLASAAGIAGLIKVAACVRERHQAPTLHCEQPNPRSDFEGSPFYVLTRGRPWLPRAGVLRGGVSAFGLGGTNAHVVIAEAPSHHPSRAPLEAPAFRRRWLWPAHDGRREAQATPARRLMQLEFLP